MSRPDVYLSVTHTSRTRSRTGIQTVVRSLSRVLRGQVTFVAAGKRLMPVGEDWLTQESPAGLLRIYLRVESALAGVWRRLFPGDNQWLKGGDAPKWLLLPEVIYRPGMAERAIEQGRSHGMSVAAIFHDALPVTHPEWFRAGLAERHAEYMKALSGVDLLLPVSQSSAEAFRRFTKEQRLPLPQIRVCRLPGELLGAARLGPDRRPAQGRIRLLTVGALEPRKNHETLLAAFDLASSTNPEISLHIVGRSFGEFPQVQQAVEQAMERNPAIHWHEQVSPAELACLYGVCDFTVYPSLEEGFGIPVLESMWAARPCICGNGGALAEHATAGCLVIDVRDSRQMADAILELAASPKLRAALSAAAASRDLRTWRDYAGEVIEALGGHA